MRASIHFSLPDELDLAKLSVNASFALACLDNFRNKLRSLVKHGTEKSREEVLEDLYTTFLELFEDHLS